MSTASQSPCWHLEGHRAALRAGQYSAVVDVERPGRGVHDLRIHDAPPAWHLMRVGVASPGPSGDTLDAVWHPLDVYVRGCDLVATYQQPLGLPYNVQIYWRASEAASSERLIVDTIVSVQTPTWEAYPAVGIDSLLPDAKKIADNGDGCAFQLDDCWRYLEFPYPGDFEHASEAVNDGPLDRFRWRFGPVFMERGVIRKLRIRGIVVPHEEFSASVEEFRAEFIAEQPPLTT